MYLNMEIIETGESILFIERTDNETREQYMERLYIIKNNYDKYKNRLDWLICLSKIHQNIVFLKCKYDQKIMDEIKELKLYIE
uniref:XRN2-binding (XTBD) domain-containing protein n=1 Tax=viral metagenome TaxID=1070528 RepID=A0A6C0EAS7_9ZZZZ